MSSLFPVSVLDADRQSGKAPILLAEAPADAPSWAAEHRDALREIGRASCRERVCLVV